MVEYKCSKCGDVAVRVTKPSKRYEGMLCPACEYMLTHPGSKATNV